MDSVDSGRTNINGFVWVQPLKMYACALFELVPHFGGVGLKGNTEGKSVLFSGLPILTHTQMESSVVCLPRSLERHWRVFCLRHDQ